MRHVDRCGNRDHDEIGATQIRGIDGGSQSGGGAQLLDRYLPRGIAKAAVTVDFGGRQVVADGVEFLAKLHRERQTHISQPDNGNDFTHLFCLSLKIMLMVGSACATANTIN